MRDAPDEPGARPGFLAQRIPRKERLQIAAVRIYMFLMLLVLLPASRVRGSAGGSQRRRRPRPTPPPRTPRRRRRARSAAYCSLADGEADAAPGACAPVAEVAGPANQRTPAAARPPTAAQQCSSAAAPARAEQSVVRAASQGASRRPCWQQSLCCCSFCCCCCCPLSADAVCVLLVLLLLLPGARVSRPRDPMLCKGAALSPREQRGAAAVAELGRGRAVGGGGGAAGLLALASPPPPSRAAAPVHSCAERPASSARPSSPDECALSSSLGAPRILAASRLCWVWRERSGARCYGRQARQGFTSSCCTLARNRSQEDELV